MNSFMLHRLDQKGHQNLPILDRFDVLVSLGMILGRWSAISLVKRKKEIKIVREGEVNYTFLDLELTDSKRDSEDGAKSNSNNEKDMIRTRSIDSKKVKIRHKNRISGGQNQQGHSSVYE